MSRLDATDPFSGTCKENPYGYSLPPEKDPEQRGGAKGSADEDRGEREPGDLSGWRSGWNRSISPSRSPTGHEGLADTKARIEQHFPTAATS